MKLKIKNVCFNRKNILKKDRIFFRGIHKKYHFDDLLIYTYYLKSILINSLSFDSETWPLSSRPWASSQKWPPISLIIIITIFANFKRTIRDATITVILPNQKNDLKKKKIIWTFFSNRSTDLSIFVSQSRDRSWWF